MGARAVPRWPVARWPALQWVRMPSPSLISLLPKEPMDSHIEAFSFSMVSASRRRRAAKSELGDNND